MEVKNKENKGFMTTVYDHYIRLASNICSHNNIKKIDKAKKAKSFMRKVDYVENP